MKKLNNEQMENLQGGLLPGPTRNLCWWGGLLTAAGLYYGDIGMDAAGLDMQLTWCA